LGLHGSLPPNFKLILFPLLYVNRAFVPIDFPIIPDRFRKLPVQNLFKTYPKPVESCSKHYPNLCISLVCAKLENGCCA
jgi:hypothetical protein